MVMVSIKYLNWLHYETWQWAPRSYHQTTAVIMCHQSRSRQVAMLIMFLWLFFFTYMQAWRMITIGSIAFSKKKERCFTLACSNANFLVTSGHLVIAQGMRQLVHCIRTHSDEFTCDSHLGWQHWCRIRIYLTKGVTMIHRCIFRTIHLGEHINSTTHQKHVTHTHSRDDVFIHFKTIFCPFCTWISSAIDYMSLAQYKYSRCYSYQTVEISVNFRINETHDLNWISCPRTSYQFVAQWTICFCKHGPLSARYNFSVDKLYIPMKYYK